jgi:hypothetical protein
VIPVSPTASTRTHGIRHNTQVTPASEKVSPTNSRNNNAPTTPVTRERQFQDGTSQQQVVVVREGTQQLYQGGDAAPNRDAEHPGIQNVHPGILSTQPAEYTQQSLPTSQPTNPVKHSPSIQASTGGERVTVDPQVVLGALQPIDGHQQHVYSHHVTYLSDDDDCSEDGDDKTKLW